MLFGQTQGGMAMVNIENFIKNKQIKVIYKTNQINLEYIYRTYERGFSRYIDPGSVESRGAL